MYFTDKKKQLTFLDRIQFHFLLSLFATTKEIKKNIKIKIFKSNLPITKKMQKNVLTGIPHKNICS